MTVVVVVCQLVSFFSTTQEHIQNGPKTSLFQWWQCPLRVFSHLYADSVMCPELFRTGSNRGTLQEQQVILKHWAISPAPKNTFLSLQFPLCTLQISFPGFSARWKPQASTSSPDRSSKLTFQKLNLSKTRIHILKCTWYIFPKWATLGQ